jgi:stage V sporulation protein SpoVS
LAVSRYAPPDVPNTVATMFRSEIGSIIAAEIAAISLSAISGVMKTMGLARSRHCQQHSSAAEHHDGLGQSKA